MYHCPLVRRACLILNKMPALSILVLMTTLLPCPSAQASSWTYVVTGDNTGTTFTENGRPGYIPPYTFKDAQGHDVIQPGSTASLPGYTINRPNNGPSGSGCAINIAVHAQVTFTWHPDPNLPSDPPPPNVLVLEGATAFWSSNSGDAMHAGSISGSAANGLGDTLYNPPNNPQGNPPPAVIQTANQGVGYSGPQPNQSYPSPTPALVQHFTSCPVVNGIVTMSQRTVTADANTTSPNWYYGAHASVSYGAYIQPQPYNWHITRVVDNGNGMLTFYYDWLSTSGNKADLTTCFEHEYVTYPGPVGTALFPLSYTMPDPFNGNLKNPTVLPGIGASGEPMTDLEIIDDQKMPALILFPHVTGSFTGTQKYEFDDTATGETDTIIPGPDSGPLPIVRSVYSPGGILWYYSLTKSGYTLTKSI